MGGEKKRGEGEREYCEVGLGLRMQSRESFPNNNSNKRMIVMPHLPACSNTSTTTLLYHHFNYKINNNNNSSNNYSYISSSPYCETMSNITSTSSTVYGAATIDGVSGGSLYCNLSNNNNKIDCWSDLYDVVSGAATSVVSGGDAVSLPRTFLPLTNSSDSSHRLSGGGGMGGKSNKEDGSGFTVRQWEELERQIVICKYMMASIPVPPHLLLTLSNSISTNSLSNQNTTSCRLDLRYTRGGGTNNDAEPWRCRRTDGKKWRCSRDVLPYQKYCERHAHKPRPRSRKPVEPQNNCHITKNITSTNSTTINNSTSPATTIATTQALQRQVFNIPAIISGANYVQPRSTEWFMKGDPILGSSLNEQWQQHLGQPSPRQGLKLYDEHERDVSVFQENYGKEHELDIHTNTFLCSNEDSSFHNRLDSDHQAQTTRHFIDAWSCADRELEIDHVNNQTPSLTLSMSGGTESDWLDTNTYTCLPPGGPLGEALCLGICSTTTKGHSNLASPHEGYSNSNSTSTCSKSSCEDNSHGLNFR